MSLVLRVSALWFPFQVSVASLGFLVSTDVPALDIVYFFDLDFGQLHYD